MKLAKMRICASCEWIFKLEHSVECPRCGFGSYGAYSVYGSSVYRAFKTQKYWKDKKLVIAVNRIATEAKEQVCCWASTHTRGWRHHTSCKNYVLCD